MSPSSSLAQSASAGIFLTGEGSGGDEEMAGEGSLMMSRLNPMQSPSASDLDEGTAKETEEYMTAYEDERGRSMGNGGPMSEYSNPMMVQ